MEQQSQTTGQQTGGQSFFSNILNRRRQLNEQQTASNDRIVLAAGQLLKAITEELQPGPEYDQSLIGLANCTMWAELGIASPANHVQGRVGGTARG